MKHLPYLLLFIVLLAFSCVILLSIFSEELVIKSFGTWFLERIILISIFLVCVVGLVYLGPRSNIFEDVESES